VLKKKKFPQEPVAARQILAKTAEEWPENITQAAS
jgi:hypothetical protein